MDWNKQLWHDRKQCCVNDSGIAQDASLRKMLNAPNFLGPPNSRVSDGRKDGGGVITSAMATAIIRWIGINF